MEPVERRHHQHEWNRIKRIQDAAEFETDGRLGMTIGTKEFWGDGDEATVGGEYDPYGDGE
jgi:hypothetical protein